MPGTDVFNSSEMMKLFKADLHTHTVLSPCGDPDMSPHTVLSAASEKGIDILAITDHNSTLNVGAFEEIAADYNIVVIGGAEVTTREEIHCITLFPGKDELEEFQRYLAYHIAKRPNSARLFGHQYVVDKEDNILDEIEYLLISGLEQTINQVEHSVHQLGGLFIPAHIDRASFSVISQLGIIPPGLKCDAVEISRYGNKDRITTKHPELAGVPFITSSDAHFPGDIGVSPTSLMLEEPTFREIGMALANRDGRYIVTE